MDVKNKGCINHAQILNTETNHEYNGPAVYQFSIDMNIAW